MSDLVTLKVSMTFTAEYVADPKDYGTNDPSEMARIDMENWNKDPINLLCSFDENDGSEWKVTVQPVDV